MLQRTFQNLLHQFKFTIWWYKANCLLWVESSQVDTLVKCDIIKLNGFTTAHKERASEHKEKLYSVDHWFNKAYLLAGRDFISDSFSRPILSFNPNFKSGIPERKHFIKTFPVTSHRRTLPNSCHNMQKQSYKENQEEQNLQKKAIIYL